MNDRPAALVLLAGGLGSRFGGPKQVEPVGPAGEPLGAYSAFDALEAGFGEVVLLTRPGAEAAVREVFAGALGAGAPIRTVPQQFALPTGVSAPVGRRRPWGTGHAALAAAAAVDGPLALANADDAYGREALRSLHVALTSADDGDAVLVTYPLHAVLSPNGGVSRGWVRGLDPSPGRHAPGGHPPGGHPPRGQAPRISAVTAAEVIEVHDLELRSADPSLVGGRTEEGEAVVLPSDTPVSMNLWGLTPGVIAALREAWDRFARGLEHHPAGPDRAEFQLSTALSQLARAGRIRITPHPGGSGWFGMTWPDDLEPVRSAVEALHRSGAYPVPLAAPRGGRPGSTPSTE